MEYKLIVMQIEVIDKEIEKLAAQKKQLTAMLSEEGLPASMSGKTYWQMAEVVLEKERKALHARDVQRRIEEEFKTKVDFKSLSQVLHAKVEQEVLLQG